MKIQSLLPHKKGTGVQVNGHVYKVGDDLVLRDATGQVADVPKEDGDRLLRNILAWCVAGETPTKAARAAGGVVQRMSLITGTGELVATLLPELAPEFPVAAPLPVPAALAANPPQVEKPVPAEGPVKDPPIPTSTDEEWADPDPRYSLGWLRACASAYKLNVRNNKNREWIAEQIQKAMYPA